MWSNNSFFIKQHRQVLVVFLSNRKSFSWYSNTLEIPLNVKRIPAVKGNKSKTKPTSPQVNDPVLYFREVYWTFLAWLPPNNSINNNEWNNLSVVIKRFYLYPLVYMAYGYSTLVMLLGKVCVNKVCNVGVRTKVYVKSFRTIYWVSY